MQPVTRPEPPAGPAVVTRPLALRRLGVGVYALVLVFALVTAIRLVSQWRDQRSHQGRAVVVGVGESDTIGMRVIDPPDPMVWGIQWPDPPEVGEVVEVELGTSCRCVPAPPSRPPTLAVVLLAVSAVPCVWCLITGTRAARRSRAGHARSLGLVGVGRPQPVDVRVCWGRGPTPFVHVTAPGGDVLSGSLARPNRELDPTVGFVAWGDLVPGATVALTSIDGLQVVPLDGPVHRADALSTTQQELTDAITATLGWPPTQLDVPDDRLARIDQAVDEARVRYRPLTVLSALGLGLIVLGVLSGRLGIWTLPLLVGLFVANRRALVWCVAPVAEAVRRVGAVPAAPLRNEVARAVTSVRWTSLSAGGRGG